MKTAMGPTKCSALWGSNACVDGLEYGVLDRQTEPLTLETLMAQQVVKITLRRADACNLDLFAMEKL